MPLISPNYFRCNFCRKDLKPIRKQRPVDYLWLLMGLRFYNCPHCFDVFLRPIGLFKVLFCRRSRPPQSPASSQPSTPAASTSPQPAALNANQAGPDASSDTDSSADHADAAAQKN
jgi:hypothetical protein